MKAHGPTEESLKEGQFPRGRLEWEGKPCLVCRQPRSSRKSQHQQQSQLGGEKCLTRLLQEAFWKVVFVCVSLTVTKMLSPCLLPWRRRSSASLSAGSVEFTGWGNCSSQRSEWIAQEHRRGQHTHQHTGYSGRESPPCTSPCCPGESALQITACSLGAESWAYLPAEAKHPGMGGKENGLGVLAHSGHPGSLCLHKNNTAINPLHYWQTKIVLFMTGIKRD